MGHFVSSHSKIPKMLSRSSLLCVVLLLGAATASPAFHIFYQHAQGVSDGPTDPPGKCDAWPGYDEACCVKPTEAPTGGPNPTDGPNPPTDGPNPPTDGPNPPTDGPKPPTDGPKPLIPPECCLCTTDAPTDAPETTAVPETATQGASVAGVSAMLIPLVVALLLKL